MHRCTLCLFVSCCGLTLTFDLMLASSAAASTVIFNVLSFFVLTVANGQFRRTNGALQEGGEREATATSQFNGIAGMRGG